MSYKVVGAAAVVEMDDGKPELGSGARVYLEQDQAVPEHAKAKHVEHLLNVGLIEEVKDDSGKNDGADKSTGATKKAG